MYYEIEFISYIRTYCFRHTPSVACHKWWSLLAARNIRNSGKYIFQKSQSILKPGTYITDCNMYYTQYDSDILVIVNYHDSKIYILSSSSSLLSFNLLLCVWTLPTLMVDNYIFSLLWYFLHKIYVSVHSLHTSCPLLS